MATALSNLRRFSLLLILIAGLFASRTALAQSAESKAQALDKKAMDEDYLTADFSAAQKKLSDAIKMCSSCSAKVRANLQRDLGTVQIGGLNDKAKATAAFVEALKLDPTITLSKDLKTKDMEAAFADAKKQIAGGGGGGGDDSGGGGGGGGGGGTPSVNDFAHTPVVEQVVKTPVPVYVEYTGSGALKRVVLRYKGFGMTEFANVDMVKMGSGYGASAKCTDVQQGDFKYFIQGFDDQNDVIASAGSRKNPFVVNIRASVDDMNGDAPRLPGKKPEKQCGETCPEGPAGKCCRDPESCKGDGGGGGTLEVGAECSESTECKSSMCTDGKCAEAAAKGKSDGESCEADNECSSESCKEGKCAAVGPKKGPRIFIGLGAAFDITFISSTDASTKKACLGGIGAPKGVTPAPDEGYRCAENGAAYPSNSTQFTGLNANGNAGAVQSGTVFGNLRILASFDYAPTGNILIGGRAGIVLNGSPISSLPYLHVEVRFHYVFGQEALWSKHAVSPYIMVGAGVSTYDAAVSVPVREAAGTPLKFVDAWASGGPVFASVGGGIRVQLGSPKAVMMLTPVKAVISIPPNSTLISLEPELAFAFGF